MLLERQQLTRPKRILSIDGGGIRGIIAAKVLLKIEKILCRPETPWNCLADYFDFMGGTSTGSILAAALARGMKVQDVLSLYLDYGREIFTKNWFLQQFWSKYSSQPLEKKLKEIFGEGPLGSEDLKTLLMIVTKNATTSHNWFFVNSPNNKFYPINRDIPLWQLIRASTAAPTFFPPQTISINNQSYDFIDGGMSMFNNPTFQLFLEATKAQYGIGWETGQDKLLLVSVGTGFSLNVIPPGRAKNYHLIDWAKYSISTLMEDANVQQNFLMSLIGNSPDELRSQMSRELASLSIPTFNELPELASAAWVGLDRDRSSYLSNLLSYHRYTVVFSHNRFAELGLSHIDPKKVAAMDCVDEIPALLEIGTAIAQEQVRAEDFDNFLHADSES
ncbi:MAG: patatin-like phospholipase family protein [Phormidium sp.]